MYELDQSEVDSFLGALARGRILYAMERGERGAGVSGRPSAPSAQPDYHLVRADRWDPARHSVAPYRPVEPLKSMVFPPRLFVGALDTPAAASEMPERVVIGVKNCDLSALRVHDWVFLQNDPPDPFYAEARRKTLLVSCDCADALDVCFCTAVREQPYARAGFDINLSPIRRGCIVEAGSERGRALLESASSMLRPARAEAVEERDRNRKAVADRVRAQAARAGLSADDDFRRAVTGTADAPLWQEFAERCVECGACNFACCTCHCFLLSDGRVRSGGEGRARLWDSCLYRNFARVAGGANPRAHRAERLYNRFDKKFGFFPQVCGFYACDGCGRCIEACTGRIDIREVLTKAVHERQPVSAGSGHD